MNLWGTTETSGNHNSSLVESYVQHSYVNNQYV